MRRFLRIIPAPTALGRPARHARSGSRHLYDIPSALAILSGAGLISALLADGLWDVVSWIAISMPAVVVAWFVLRPVGSK